MATVLLASSAATSAITSAGTFYLAIGDGYAYRSSTEAYLQTTIPSAGTLSNLGLNVVANTWVSSPTVDAVFALRINGALGNEQISIADGQTGFFEDTDSDAVAANDEVGARFVLPAGSGSFSMVPTWVLWSHTGGTGFWATTTYTNDACSVDSQTTYHPVGGYRGAWGTTNTTRSNAQIEVNDSYTVTQLGCYVSANSRTTNTVLSFENNGSVGDLSITIAAGVTGLLADTTGSVSLVTGDLINYVFITGASDGNQIRVTNFNSYYTNANSKWFFVSATGTSSITSQNKATTAWCPVGGTGIFDSVSEDIWETETPIAFTASNLWINVTTNTVAGASTVSLNQNGDPTALIITVPGDTTGIYEDTDSVSIAIDDDLSYETITGADAGSGGFFTYARTFTGAIASAGGANIKAAVHHLKTMAA